MVTESSILIAKRIQEGNVGRGKTRAVTGPEEHTLTVRTQEHDGRVEVTFEDTGPGMSSDIYGRLFEPLYSTKGFGVGLGLPVVK